jgi:hypothetical protein
MFKPMPDFSHSLALHANSRPAFPALGFWFFIVSFPLRRQPRRLSVSLAR